MSHKVLERTRLRPLLGKLVSLTVCGYASMRDGRVYFTLRNARDPDQFWDGWQPLDACPLAALPGEPETDARQAIQDCPAQFAVGKQEVWMTAQARILCSVPGWFNGRIPIQWIPWGEDAAFPYELVEAVELPDPEFVPLDAQGLPPEQQEIGRQIESLREQHCEVVLARPLAGLALEESLLPVAKQRFPGSRAPELTAADARGVLGFYKRLFRPGFPGTDLLPEMLASPDRALGCNEVFHAVLPGVFTSGLPHWHHKKVELRVDEKGRALSLKAAWLPVGDIVSVTPA